MMDQTNEETTRPTHFGQRLKIARETLGLTIQDVADHLHLNPKMIHAIEDENFTDTPPAIFMRGYLRSYSRLLQFSEVDTNTAIEALGLTVQPHTAHPPCLEAENTNLANNQYITAVTYLVIAVSLALVGFWWTSHPGYRPSDLGAPLIAQDHTILSTKEPTRLASQSLPESVQPKITTTLNHATKTNPQLTLPSSTQNAPPLSNHNASIAIVPNQVATNTSIATLQTPTASNITPPQQPQEAMTSPSLPSLAQNKQADDADIKAIEMSLPEPGLESD